MLLPATFRLGYSGERCRSRFPNEPLAALDKQTITRFIVKHIIKNSTVMQQHSVGGAKGTTATGRAVFKPTFKAAINRSILLAFFELVVLMDKLKRRRLLKSTGTEPLWVADSAGGWG